MLYIYLARICLFPMFCKCREFSKWIRDLCVLPERLASAHTARPRGTGEARARRRAPPPARARRPADPAREPGVRRGRVVCGVSRVYIPIYP